MKLWQFLKQQYAFVIRTAATPLAHWLMLLYAALESIILPIPVDPLLAAVVLAAAARLAAAPRSCDMFLVVHLLGKSLVIRTFVRFNLKNGPWAALG